MPAEEPPRFLQSVHIEYPDDDSTKDVYLQAASLSYPGFGDRHVLIWWLNASCDEEDDALQVIQLTGQAGNYHYFFPVVERSPTSLRASNQQFVLGTFTRAQREQILNLADEVAFSVTSTVGFGPGIY
ncbi:hypothetical protein ONZ45_g15434 [Pleurotus djamor]|nr:hypothetical protein ONZ45_g15434 [Pleurotus djamor]